jgi:hypothetical protein
MTQQWVNLLLCASMLLLVEELKFPAAVVISIPELEYTFNYSYLLTPNRRRHSFQIVKQRIFT